MKRFLLSFAALTSVSFIAAPSVNAQSRSEWTNQFKCERIIWHEIQKGHIKHGGRLPKNLNSRNVELTCRMIPLALEEGFTLEQAVQSSIYWGLLGK